MGAVSIRPAYSRDPASSENCKYVQDRLYHNRTEIVELFDAGAKLFVCGSSEVGNGVQEVLIKIAKERSEEIKGESVSDEKAREWFEGLRNERFATDVFA